MRCQFLKYFVHCPLFRRMKFGLELSLVLRCWECFLLPSPFPSDFPCAWLWLLWYTSLSGWLSWSWGDAAWPASSSGSPQHQREPSLETLGRAAASVAPHVSPGSRLGLLPCMADAVLCPSQEPGEQWFGCRKRGSALSPP